MDIFDNIITRMESFSGDEIKNKKIDIHIAFGIDANFARGMGVCITSIILNNLDKNIEFHIFTDQLHVVDLEKLKQLTTYKNISIKIYYIDANGFKAFPITIAWSQAIYYRFIMAKFLCDKVDKVLYLDADILCIGSLDGLIQEDMQGNIILAIEDQVGGLQERITYLSMQSKQYFNSGVMYIDINRWNKEKITDKAIDLLRKYPERYKSFDQDVLNVLLDGKTNFIDRKWNYIYNLGYMEQALPGNVNLIHFTGDKPWQQWTQHHFMVKCYEAYSLKSPWNSVPLTVPFHYKEKRRMAKSCKKNGEYLQAFIWFVKYIYTRIQIKCKE
ncbi:glycosyltransferase family 8 protein [Propionispira raffinosivorans]|uniref:glycosyltransferase family 8 protein n=1 Tax=Propionispira raffinosivorans TaxID=86959 RepID=UPI000364E6B5|nr:glycosyltransferase [Propionispira raffinosivorans]